MSEYQERPDDQSGEDKGGGSALGFLLSLPRLLASRYGLAALGVAILGGLIYLTASADGFVRSSELEKELIRLKAEIAELEDANRLLHQKLDSRHSDMGYIEDEARKKLGLIRPGEIIYRLAEEPDLADDRPLDPSIVP